MLLPKVWVKITPGDEQKMNKMKMKNKITKETNLAEILKYPEMEKILAKYNLPCLTCPLAKFEIEKLKIGEVCQMYGIDLESLLKELNEKLKT